MIKVHLRRESQPAFLSPGAFESRMGIKYLPTLHFDTEKLRAQIVKKCERAIEKGLIKRQQRWQGSYFAKELAKGYCPELLVRWVSSAIGYGVFAEQKFLPGDFVSEYTGIVKKRSFWRRTGGNYLFYYALYGEPRSPYYIDAEECGNISRFINHSAQGNVHPNYVYTDGVIHLVLIAKREIPIGAQICYDYGDLYWKRRESPLRIDP